MGSTIKRSIIKASIWELFSFVITTLAAMLVLKSWVESLEFSAVLTLVKIVLLFSYERGWKTIKWGKK